MKVVRVLGALALVAAAFVIWFAMAPMASPDAADVSGTSSQSIDAAVAADRINQASTSSAPQQSVVNGWTARDLLEIIARQGAVAPDADERPAALLVVAVIGIALILFTARPPSRRSIENSSSVPLSPAPLDADTSGHQPATPASGPAPNEQIS